jgi:two-component system NtrC family response regulator
VATRLFGHEYLRARSAGPRPLPPSPVKGLVFPPDIVVGRSPSMRRLYEELATVVGGNLPVLVLGETGVGKEHIARVLHDSSPRRDRPFVTINCAAIPAELLEAELFGIERGVATGVSERIGKFREAHGGTLFLDEIGELPLPLQSKLLRVLEEKKVQPVGGQAAAVDLRIVAATNVPLDEVAASGRFRLDLFHRLAGFVVSVPPLRERVEDVPLLFDHFLRASRGYGGRLAPPALAALVRHRWTGNVRELRHEAARIAARAGNTTEIGLADLSPSVAASFAGSSTAPAGEAVDAGPRTLDEELARIERALLATALRDTAGNVSHAAQRLGISRARLRRRARELGVERG